MLYNLLDFALTPPSSYFTGTEVVVKAQVLAGGRGKGAFDSGFQGGVHMADTYVNFKIN